LDKSENKRKKVLQEAEETPEKYLLSASVNTHAESVGKKLSDFDLRFVDGVVVRCENLENAILDCKYQMIEKGLALGAERVADIKPTITTYRKYPSELSDVYMIGTALIPKQEKK